MPQLQTWHNTKRLETGLTTWYGSTKKLKRLMALANREDVTDDALNAVIQHIMCMPEI